MEELLNDIVPQEDLEKFEKKYHIEIESNGEATTTAKFEYAFCLVRSRYTNDICKGIMILEDLTRTNPADKRDYIYYLAYGNARIKNYTEALKYCHAFLEIESNEQVRALEEYIQKENTKGMVRGIAVASTAAVVIGGIVGVGLALAKK